MRAALEITLVYTVNGANVTASTAANALFIINRRKVIYNRYSTYRTGFFAFSASDTSVFTELSYVSATLFIITLNNNT